MPAGFATGFAARVGLLGLLETLAGAGLVAAELQGDALAEQRARVAPVHREGLFEFGERLVQVAVGEGGAAGLYVLVGVGDELDAEHRLAGDMAEDHAHRTEPREGDHFGRGPHSDVPYV